MTDTSSQQASGSGSHPTISLGRWPRTLATASPDRDESLEHFGVVGDTDTILLSGRDTAGRYTLIDMHVPPGGGSPPHRHDFEEMFSILDGEIELTFRGQTSIARVGDTVNILATAPHVFRNRMRSRAFGPETSCRNGPVYRELIIDGGMT